MATIRTYKTWSGLTVDIASDAMDFTVYSAAGKPAGTIQRRRMFSGAGAKVWSAYALDGTLVDSSDYGLFLSLLRSIDTHNSAS